MIKNQKAKSFHTNTIINKMLIGKNVYTIPFEDKYIIYQPLNQFAFIGNQAMIDFIKKIIDKEKLPAKKADNIYRFLKSYRFFEGLDTELPIIQSKEYQPTTCVLCMTNSCNLNCIYCFANAGDNPKIEMDFDIAKNAIDKVYENAKNQNLSQFTISFHGGGEPTLPFEKLKKITKYAKNKDLICNIELTSNGYWNNKQTLWIIENIDSLTLSFDGIQKIQNNQRPLKNGKGTFKKIINNIKILDNSNINYGIRLTVTNESIKILAENIEFLCKNTNCNIFQVEPAFPEGRALKNNQNLNLYQQFIDNFSIAFDLATKYQRKLYYSGARLEVLTNRFCLAQQNALIVTPNGNLSMCYEVTEPSHPLYTIFHFGKINKISNFEIDKKKTILFETDLQKRKKKCEQCFVFWHCAGDCPAKTYNTKKLTNTLFTKRCYVNKEITKQLLIKELEKNNGIYFKG